MATSSANEGPVAVVGGALIVVAIAVMVGGAHSWAVQSGENPIRLRVDTSEIQGVTLGDTGNADTPDAGPRVLEYEIGTEDAYALWADGLAVFLDARALDEYEMGHIAYSRYLDYKHLYDAPFPDVVNELLGDVTQPLVIYCTGGDCDASHNAAAFFQNLDFTTIHVYTDGYPGWVDAEFEIEDGPDPFAEQP